MGENTFRRQLPWLVLLVLFIAGTSLWELFVSEQRSHLDEVFRYEAEQLADELVRTTLQGQFPDHLPDDIVGFGLYGPRGELLVRYGTVPETQRVIKPRLGEPRNGRHFEAEHEGVLDFVKRLDRPGPLRQMEGIDDQAAAPVRMVGGSSLVLRLKVDRLTSRALIWDAGVIAGPLVWAGFLGFIGWLWYRNRHYQEAMSRNHELLQFAEAAKTLSHEIKNPLAAILLQTALLKKASTGELSPEVVIIEEETQRINHLVSRVRDFLKDPSGQPEVVDLGKVVAALVDRFPEPISQAGQEEGPYPVRFDPHRLRSVLENLLKNAVESGPQPQPEVRLSSPRAGWVRIEVLDRGTGFSPESLRQASTPFFTTKLQGSGIGLSIAQGFVKGAGGTLKWENRPDGGARVWVDLPEVKA